MTTILVDERDGKQKVLIRTYKGDFFHIDVDEQNLQAYFENDIVIKCNNDLKITSNGDIDLKSLSGDIRIQADSGSLDMKSGTAMRHTAGGLYSARAQKDAHIQAGQSLHQKAGLNVNIDGTILNEQSGSSTTGPLANDATEADPVGERDT
jgi:hypothetical protein